MAIHKIKIENFKIFEGVFELEFNQGINILVGDNEVGKSTVIEAIHLVLTGMINGKYLNTELTQYLFNNNVVNKYIQSIADGKPMEPPAAKPPPKPAPKAERKKKKKKTVTTEKRVTTEKTTQTKTKNPA